MFQVMVCMNLIPNQGAAWLSVTQRPAWVSSPQRTWGEKTQVYLTLRTCPFLWQFPRDALSSRSTSRMEMARGGPLRGILIPTHLVFIFGKEICPVSSSAHSARSRFLGQVNILPDTPCPCLLGPVVQGGNRQSSWNLITSFPTTGHLDSVTLLFCLSESTQHLKSWCRIPSF